MFTSSTSLGEPDSVPINNWDIQFQWLSTVSIDFGMFLRFRMEQPVYINIIRDPISRFLSNYFFRRFGDWRGEQNHLIRTPRMKDNERYLVCTFLSLFSPVLSVCLLLSPLCFPTYCPQGCVRLYGKSVTWFFVKVLHGWCQLPRAWERQGYYVYRKWVILKVTFLSILVFFCLGANVFCWYNRRI